jgi:hypothetical protein
MRLASIGHGMRKLDMFRQKSKAKSVDKLERMTGIEPA